MTGWAGGNRMDHQTTYFTSLHTVIITPTENKNETN